MVSHRGTRNHNLLRSLGKDVRSFRLPNELLSSFIEDFYIALDSPVALSCYMLYKYSEHDQLAAKGIDPHQYIDGESFRRDYCAVSFLSKYPDLDTTFDRRKTALLNFVETEAQCKATNQRLRSERCRTANLHHEAVLSAQSQIIATILGEVDGNKLFDRGSFGPGTTATIHGDDTSSSRKYLMGNDITRGAYQLLGEVMKQHCPSWAVWLNPRFVPGCSVSTVPKNAKTDRTTATEPTLNTWCQLAIGRHIRSRLRSFGYDLDRDDKNRRYALLGARHGSIATIDFRNASNTIAIAAVERLVPSRWFLTLDACRSHNYSLTKGTWFPLEVFSTMGNGFTFELESLIFVTAALAVCRVYGLSERGISIFGDDLTCSSEVVPHLTEYITYLGFELNRSKSYSTGYFRESCGDHYFGTFDCKPLLLRGRVKSLAQVYDFADRLFLLAHRFTSKNGLDRRFRALWHRVIEAIPKDLRFYGPASYGSSVLFTHKRPEDLAVKRHKDWDGWCFTHLSVKAITVGHESHGHLLARLRAIGQRPDERRFKLLFDVVSGRLPSTSFDFRVLTTEGIAMGNDVPLRGRAVTIVSDEGFAQQWYNFDRWY